MVSHHWYVPRAREVCQTTSRLMITERLQHAALLLRGITVIRGDAHLQSAGANYLVSSAVRSASLGHADRTDQTDLLGAAACDLHNQRPVDLQTHLRGRTRSSLDI